MKAFYFFLGMAIALLTSRVSADLPITFSCENDTGIVLYVGNPDGNWIFDGALCNSELNLPYTQFLSWWKQQGVNSIAIMAQGAQQFHAVPIFNRPLPIIATSNLFIVPRKGQEVIYQGRELIFDIFQHGSHVTFRIIALPLTNKGAKS